MIIYFDVIDIGYNKIKNRHRKLAKKRDEV